MEESIKIVFNDLEGKISYKPMSVKGDRKLKSIQTIFDRSNSLDVHLFIFPRKQSTLPLTLVDARLADTNPEDCTLILCEGESAKSLIMAGLSSLGDGVGDKFGILPFRGNILNPGEATIGTIYQNAEIQDLIRALGLDQTNYKGFKSLRYHKILIMSDQDHDGLHFKGLVVNLIYNLWPALLKESGFLAYFNLPIVTATKDDTKEFFPFYYQNIFEKWCKDREGLDLYRIKYYKGLASFTNSNAIKYFKDMEQRKINFCWKGREDKEAIRLAFEKGRADKRKEWMKSYKSKIYVERQDQTSSYSEFIHQQYISFALAAVRRAIPSIVDGLKPSQRKILYGAFKKQQWKEIRVDQFSGSVSEVSAYHHSDDSLALTIILMAQRFVGSNNLNLLQPIGQFGSRRNGGKDHASPRYIWTKLNDVTRSLFHEEDNNLLNYRIEDGLSVEPLSYYPIIPLVLVNRCHGTGVGWSTKIPNYSAKDIIEALESLLCGKDLPELTPFYVGFTGDIKQTPDQDGFYTYGRVSLLGDNFFRIEDLPINIWTENFKKKLASTPFVQFQEKGNVAGNTTLIVQLREGHTLFDREYLSVEDIVTEFSLKSKISTANMCLHDFENKIRKYDSVEEIVQEFYAGRLKLYNKRKKCMVKRLEQNVKLCKNKHNFAKRSQHNDLRAKFSEMSNVEVAQWFKGEKFYCMDGYKEGDVRGFNYLRDLLDPSEPAIDLTKLKQERDHAYDQLKKVGGISSKKMWLTDLKNLSAVLGFV